MHQKAVLKVSVTSHMQFERVSFHQMAVHDDAHATIVPWRNNAYQQDPKLFHLTRPSKPEATSRHAGLVRRKRLREQLRIFDMHPLTGPEHFECHIEAQERLQEVLLIPESMPIQHPLLRIFQGHKDVVHVYNYSRLDARQNLQKQKFHIAPDFAHVPRTNEQNIVLAEQLKL